MVDLRAPMGRISTFAAAAAAAADQQIQLQFLDKRRRVAELAPKVGPISPILRRQVTFVAPKTTISPSQVVNLILPHRSPNPAALNSLVQTNPIQSNPIQPHPVPPGPVPILELAAQILRSQFNYRSSASSPPLGRDEPSRAEPG